MTEQNPDVLNRHPEYLIVGRALGAWGVCGDFKVQQLTDFPDRFSPQREVYLDGRPHIIQRCRRSKDHLILKLSDIDTVDAAKSLSGKDIEIPLCKTHTLPPGDYYYYQIIGLEVISTQSEPVGKIVQILPTGSNDVYVVVGPHGEVLVPAIEDVVRSIDLDRGQMTIEMIDGLA